MTKVPVLAFLENVASSPKEVMQAYSQWVGGAPIQISAQDWGWVHRSRLFWLSGPIGDLHQLHEPQLPQGKSVARTTLEDIEIFKLCVHSKPFPPTITWALGFTHVFDQHRVGPGSGDACFHTFTREFWHPTDRVKFSSPAAAQRFHDDSRRFGISL